MIPEPGHVMHLGSYRDVLDHLAADLILTSPPYNVGWKQDRQDGRRRTGQFDPRSFSGITGYADNLPEDAYQDSQAAFLIWAAAHLAPGGTLVYNHKPRQRRKTLLDPHQWLLRPEVRACLTEATYPVTWDRSGTHNHGRGQLWQQTERLYILRRAIDTGWTMNNHASRGLDPRFQGDVWRIPLTTHQDNGHNAPFPLELARAVIAMWSRPGQLVADPYAGSGTTGVAALELGRRFEGAEIVSRYHQQAADRLQRAQDSAGTLAA